MMVIHSATKENVEKPNKGSKMKHEQVMRRICEIKDKCAILNNKIDALRMDTDTMLQQSRAQFQKIRAEALQMRNENAEQFFQM